MKSNVERNGICDCDYPEEANCAVHRACDDKVAMIAAQRIYSAILRVRLA